MVPICPPSYVIIDENGTLFRSKTHARIAKSVSEYYCLLAALALIVVHSKIG